MSSFLSLLVALFRIRDIFIRIRILESVLKIADLDLWSVLQITDPDPDPALLGSGFQDTNKNVVFFFKKCEQNIFLFIFLCLFLTVVR
jgi:hypothetical protein